MLGLVLSLPDIPFLKDHRPDIKSWWVPIALSILLLTSFVNLVFGTTLKGLYGLIQEKMRFSIESYFDNDI